jgi:hypothetical protein
MSRETILIALGVLIAITPYLGLPLKVLGILLPILGLITAFIGFTLRSRNLVQVLPREAPERIVPVYETPEA